MSTRTRSASRQKGNKPQGSTLTDHFQPTKSKGSESRGKSLIDYTSSTTSAKRTLFSTSRVAVIPNEVEVETLPVQTKKPEVKPRPARALFGVVPKKEEKVKKEIKKEPVKEDVKEKVVEPIRSIIPTEEDIVDHKPAVIRKPGCADLQTELVKKGGAAKIHEQTTARKLEQIAEREAMLKSPQKMIKTTISGGSPPKRAKRDNKKSAPVKVLPAPDYVLPTKSTETGKNRAEREISEERETSPQEDSMTRAPNGYGRSLMNDEVKMSSRVVLPSEYEALLATFKSCDQIVSRCEGRTLTFTQLSRDVTKITNKKFSIDRFCQLLAVYPRAYTVRVKQFIGNKVAGTQTRYEHVVKANLDDDLTSFVTGPLHSEQPLPSEPILTTSPRKNMLSPMKGRPITSSAGIRIPASPRKPSSPVKLFQREVVMDTSKRLEGWRINCRQQVFRCLLARRVIAAHEKFIGDLKLDPSVLPLSSPFLPRIFHDHFTRSIDSSCPPIEKAEIEPLPEEEMASNSFSGMGDFIKIAVDTVNVIPKSVEQAILELRSPEKKTVSSRGVPLSPSKFAQAPKQTSVLERIKAKKAAEAALKMRRNSELEAKMADLTRLIDNKNASLIFNILQTASKTSMDINFLVNKLGVSGITKEKVPSLLTRLTSLVPMHFSINSTSLGKYIRVHPDNSAATCTIVESLLKKEMEVCLRQSSAGSPRVQ